MKLEKNIGWIICERWQMNNIKRLERTIDYALRKKINIYNLVRSPVKRQVSIFIRDSLRIK